jgi:hypothetical protein
VTNNEAKEALFAKTPVVYKNTEYSYISAIIYRVDKNNGLFISAELMDKNERSVTIAQLKDVIAAHDQ